MKLFHCENKAKLPVYLWCTIARPQKSQATNTIIDKKLSTICYDIQRGNHYAILSFLYFVIVHERRKP
jgi:hypothetical protein